MRIINIIGLLVFLKIFLTYNSILAFIIFFNGILFHSYEKNNYLKNYDIFCNFLITSYFLYNYFHLVKFYYFISIGIFLLNSYFFEEGFYNRDISDFIHIIGVQYVLSLAFVIVLKKNKSINK